MRLIICLLVGLLISMPALALDRINLLFIGQVVPETCPLPFWFESEPAATFTLVPTKVHWRMDLDEARRQVRLYFPRTRELTWEYDFFMYINPYFEPFTPVQIDNMYSAITENGGGGFQTLGGITIDSAEPNFAWLQSTLAPAFPNDPSAVELWRQTTAGRAAYKVVLEKDSGLPPVLTPFLDVGIEEVPGSTFYIVAMEPQEGTTTWARAAGAFPKVTGREFPWLLSWGVGSGMTWSVADDLDVPWWSSIYEPSKQEYGLDILMNIIQHSLGRPIPQDVIVVNAVRRNLRNYNERVSTINAFIDFIEKFGANSNQVLGDKAEVDEIIEGARDSYLDSRYDEALALSEEANRAIVEFELRTMRLKDQALLWVYFTEWVAVSGTLLLSGYLVFFLMLRRGLYRRVRTTRLRSELE